MLFVIWQSTCKSLVYRPLYDTYDSVGNIKIKGMPSIVVVGSGVREEQNGLGTAE